jgi:two-component system CheB/CheR fusion protein
MAACGWCKDAEHALRQRDQAHVSTEAQHRLRNNAALIRSIIRRSNETAESAEHFALHLEARIGALSRTQAVLTTAADSGVELEDLVRSELIANAVFERRYLVQGPPVRLHAKAAESLALAIHELATNSLKFGALAAASGSVAISWRVTDERTLSRLHLTWVESGATIVSAAPRRRGFGLELIECTLPYELGAQSRLTFNPGGVHCEIEIPLEACVATIEPPAPQAALGGPAR